MTTQQPQGAIPYEAAVDTIQTMFNNSVEREVVCAVLEANNGHMERTIECLLNISGELPIEEQVTNSTAINSSQSSDTQIKDDELLARMLQNQLFMTELKQHPEFDQFFLFEDSPSSSTSESDVDIVNSLKQLGSAAKLKFKELALKFSKNKSTTNKPDVKYSAVKTEDDDTEVVAFDSSLAKRTATSFTDSEPHISEDGEVPLSSKRSNKPGDANATVDSSSSDKTRGKHKDD